jgi:hypothetical protein
MLCLQTFIYVKQYPKDPKHLKALVCFFFPLSNARLMYRLRPPTGFSDLASYALYAIRMQTNSCYSKYRAMDTLQTGCIVSLSFQYTILHFMRPEIIDHVFMHVSWTLCLFDDADIAPDCLEQLWYVRSCQDALTTILIIIIRRHCYLQ